MTLPSFLFVFVLSAYLLIYYNKDLSGTIFAETCGNDSKVVADCLDTYAEPLVSCDCCVYCCDPRKNVCVPK